MFRQAVFQSSRALRSAPRSLARAPLLRTQLSPVPLAAARPSRLIPNQRWYSDSADAEAKKDKENGKAAPADSEVKPTESEPSKVKTEESKPAEGKDAETPKGVDAEVAELKTKLEKKDREAIDWKDKYLRSVADFRNLQDRTQRDMKAARDFAIQKFAKDLVDSVDNLDRALSMGQEKLNTAEGEEKNEDLASFYEGVKMTETLMMQTLKKHGLERFDPEGEKFNPNEHEATFMTPMPDKEDNTIFHVQQKGFKLNGRVLRAAKVGVVKAQQ